MAPSSPSSLYLSHHQANPFPTLTPKPTLARFPLSPLSPQTLAFSSRPSTQNQNQNHNQTQKLDSSQLEEKSFAIATGELFLGIASLLITSRNSTNGANALSETGFLRDKIEPVVMWEQKVKDVEAEQTRRVVVTGPGFSFSAAGLLLPYHLGVAQFLIEKGYNKETPPLAGSSAGAIVCVAIASGASMQEALMAAKVLADDCRRRGTAFRLGAVLLDVLDKFLPEDSHTRSNGRVRIAVAETFGGPRGLLVDQFDSREDLINAPLASSIIPR
ncbi:LOW QUALITY PROTEIN: uncharacterized protein LOC115727207 [Rhodamnia argentea]|uniref:Patatin n=1 Tax=Rhodamnia argentea TaxID=178133 RepID=A0A8B8MT38_9MYRT|nr:LOW QUALITY PROTEIN: uncharacterized protein LOC115727207 [Rhodamnia argentea]